MELLHRRKHPRPVESPSRSSCCCGLLFSISQINEYTNDAKLFRRFTFTFIYIFRCLRGREYHKSFCRLINETHTRDAQMHLSLSLSPSVPMKKFQETKNNGQHKSVPKPMCHMLNYANTCAIRSFALRRQRRRRRRAVLIICENMPRYTYHHRRRRRRRRPNVCFVYCLLSLLVWCFSSVLLILLHFTHNIYDK